ncbi:MAG: Ryanodine receptor Ryr, partial [Oscillospiraceae bacterium]|nr:Ryanodine receptor Ryr [Oscillospiraceae bacterium]
MSEGWRYGAERSDKDKTTPCFIPYSELSETEKDHDRNTAIETVKAT